MAGCGSTICAAARVSDRLRAEWAPATIRKFSPNGEYVSFIRDHGLAVSRLKEPGAPAIAGGCAAPNTATLNGEVDWVYEEELDVRSNYFWSPDSKAGLICRWMRRGAGVSDHRLDSDARQVDMQRYPQPGDPNPEVRVGVVERGGRQDGVGEAADSGRAGLHSALRLGGPKTLWIETVTRDHKHREYLFCRCRNGQAHAVLKLSDEKFFDEKYDVSVGDGSDRADKLERRAQSSLSLQL